jgi:hypothetical protein
MLNRFLLLTCALALAGCPGVEPSVAGGGGDDGGGNPPTTGPSSGGAGATVAGPGGADPKGGSGGTNAGGENPTSSGGAGGGAPCDPTNPPLDDVSNCGACGRSCSAFEVADLACVEGKCTSTCVPGYANVNVPPGTDQNGDELNDDGCEQEAWRVFVTKDVISLMQFGSAEEADDLCTALADANPNLQGSDWVAWVSDDIGQLSLPLVRLGLDSLADPVAYVLVRLDSSSPDKLVVGDAFQQLVANMMSLDNPINGTQEGTTLGGGPKPVWTGLLANGLPGPNCESWSATESTAVIGNANRSDQGWTEDSQLSTSVSCGAQAGLYCFEKPPAQ